MPAFFGTRPATPRELDEIAAQRIACALLIKSCEAASFDFGMNSTYANGKRTERINRRAAQICSEVIASWREALSIIETIEISQTSLGGMVYEAAIQQSNPGALTGPSLT